MLLNSILHDSTQYIIPHLMQGCKPNTHFSVRGSRSLRHAELPYEIRIHSPSMPIICALVGLPRMGSMVLPKKV